MRRITWVGALAVVWALAGSALGYEPAPAPAVVCCPHPVLPALRGEGCTMPATFSPVGACLCCCERPSRACEHVWDSYCKQHSHHRGCCCSQAAAPMQDQPDGPCLSR